MIQYEGFSSIFSDIIFERGKSRFFNWLNQSIKQNIIELFSESFMKYFYFGYKIVYTKLNIPVSLL